MSARLRRDPRTERAASARAGGVRPRFELFGGPSASARPRRDPRAERRARQVEGNARPHFDLSLSATAAGRAFSPRSVAAEPAAPKTLMIEAPAFLVGAALDAPGGRLTPHDRQVLGAAQVLAAGGGAVVALAFGPCEGLEAAGADRAAALEGGGSYDPDGRAAQVVVAMAALGLRHVLFPETAEGGDLARRVATLTGEPLFADAESVSAKALSRAALGRRVERRSAPTRLITVAADAVAPYAGPPREARPEDIAAPAGAGGSAILSAQKVEADLERMPLALADFVVSAGNGVTDLELFRRTAKALGGAPGASRVLCDAGLMPRETQVGASGTVLAATCYLALGIAGAPQHLQGVAGCEHVIAVNTDLHAAMVERAGLAIIQDAQLVMPALIAALAAEREG